MKNWNDKQEYSDIGERISSALQDAMESRNFEELSQVVSDSVSGAIDEVRRTVNTISQAANGQTDGVSGWHTSGQANSTAGRSGSAAERSTNSQTDSTASGRSTSSLSGWHTSGQASSAAGSARNAAGPVDENGQPQSYAERYRYTYKKTGGRTTYASQRQNRTSHTQYSSDRMTSGGQYGTGTDGRSADQSAGAQAGSRAQRAGSSQTALRTQETNGVLINRTGKTGGILRIVFGSIGLGTFSVTALANLIYWAFQQTVTAAVPVVVTGLLALACGGFVSKGCKILGRLKRAERYAKLGGKRRYLELEDIARNTGRSLKKVRADVRRMLQLGIFPEGHMDSQESCLILDDETWQQYKITQKEWESRKGLEADGGAVQNRAGAAGRKGAAGKNNGANDDGANGSMSKSSSAYGSSAGQNGGQPGSELDAQAAQIVREGQAYMDRLRDLNIEIPGEVISNKLYELDYLLTRIFAVIRQRPENSSQMRKFMEYYLPTTVKLVESYADFDKAGVQGDNITSAKAEIEKTMDTINQAFEKLLDDFYRSAAMETTADAQVLKTLLAQDGYTKSDFDIK